VWGSVHKPMRVASGDIGYENGDVLICIFAPFLTTRFKFVMTMNLLELRS
jgi:hypothetical protein